MHLNIERIWKRCVSKKGTDEETVEYGVSDYNSGTTDAA